LAVGRRRSPVIRSASPSLFVLLSAFCLLLSGTAGCEALQRKFTRKPKKPQPPPTPIIQFQDYTRAMTPLDRYRKHYLMFDYWNDELLEALGVSPLNSKRLKRSSTEALGELETIKVLVQEEVGAKLDPWIARRSEINRQLHAGVLNESQVRVLQRELEAQTWQFQRDFFWRDVEDRLQ